MATRRSAAPAGGAANVAASSNASPTESWPKCLMHIQRVARSEVATARPPVRTPAVKTPARAGPDVCCECSECSECKAAGSHVSRKGQGVEGGGKRGDGLGALVIQELVVGPAGAVINDRVAVRQPDAPGAPATLTLTARPGSLNLANSLTSMRSRSPRTASRRLVSEASGLQSVRRRSAQTIPASGTWAGVRCARGTWPDGRIHARERHSRARRRSMRSRAPFLVTGRGTDFPPGKL